MKWLFSIVGIVLVLLGSVWTLQGVDILKRGFMAGRPQYAVLGIVVIVVGVVLLVYTNRRRSGTPTAK